MLVGVGQHVHNIAAIHELFAIGWRISRHGHYKEIFQAIRQVGF